MKSSTYRFALLLVGLLALPAVAQQATSSANNSQTLPTGDWKGTSICKARPGSCHDEVVVYHIKAAEQSKDSYSMSADKIIDGELQDMGTLACTFAAKESTLTCHYRATDTWTFKIAGDAMHGTLTVDGQLVRVIEAKKVKKDWRTEYTDLRVK